METVYKNKKDLINSLVGKEDVVLDVGFWGQGVKKNKENWVHGLLSDRAKEVYGLDIDFEENALDSPVRYKKASAENFDFENKFDVIFAADLIEHLSNPGMFLQSCARNLKPNGRLIITTPNCFNLFNIAEKFSKNEPTVNKDHTCYFNFKTLKRLLEKNNFITEEPAFLYSLDIGCKESLKKKILNLIYFIFSKFTSKFIETLVVSTQKQN